MAKLCATDFHFFCFFHFRSAFSASYGTFRKLITQPFRHNPRSGSWGEWGPWGDCSRTCGAGVSFGVRSCDNPRPAYGGDPCYGEKEVWKSHANLEHFLKAFFQEFRLCNIEECLDSSTDFRAEQCQNLFEFISQESLPFGGQDLRGRQEWTPFESENEDRKCELICASKSSGEKYQTGENVIDGTKCSYDEPSNICVQGKCIQVGCDKVKIN